jgi:CBS domain-containing protein
MPNKNEGIFSELISNTVLMDHKTPITKIIPLLGKYGAVVVTKDGDYYGIIDSRSVSRQKGLEIKRSGAYKFAERVPPISDFTPIDDVVFYFYKTRRKALPYTKNGRVTGILERSTLLKVLLSMRVLEDMKVQNSMSSPVLAIDSNATISQAKSVMGERKVNRLIVLQDGKFAGLITNHDLSMRYSAQSERLPEMKSEKHSTSSIRIADAAEKNPIMISDGSNLAEAARSMVERSISSVIVQRGGKPVGMLTVFDILESLIAQKQISETKVFISGLDNTTYEYGDDARNELNAFVSRIEKMRNMKVNYVTLHVKGIKTKSYEMQIRVALDKHGVISMQAYGERFADTLGDLMQSLRNKITREKEQNITLRRVSPPSE